MTLKLDNSIPKDPYTKQLCAVNSYFSVYSAIFGMVTNDRTNKQPGDPSASLLLTSKKAVFCNLVKMWLIYFVTRILERKQALDQKKCLGKSHKKMTNRIPLTNKISVGGQWVRDSPTKLYLKVLYFKNSTKSHIQE